MTLLKDLVMFGLFMFVIYCVEGAETVKRRLRWIPRTDNDQELQELSR